MKVRRARDVAVGDDVGRPAVDVITMGAVPAAVTALVFVPQLLSDPGQSGPGLNLAWLALLLTGPPLAAAVLGRQRRVAVHGAHLLLVGLPQLPVTVALTRLDTWLEVRSGYLLAGSGEEAMSYGIGTIAGVVVGLVLTGLVALGAHLGGRRSPATRAGSRR